MNDLDDDNLLPPRRASVAVLLSLLGAGIGHIYAGRALRGFVLFAASLAFAPLILLLALVAPSTLVLYTMFAIVLATLGIYLYAIVDSILAARRAMRPYAAATSNHVGLYLLLAAVSIGWLLGGLVVLRGHGFEAYYIPTRSMHPTLECGDRILVNKFRASEVKRGELVVFKPPAAGGRIFIKRVVGLPGDAVHMKDGTVFVNGTSLTRPAAPGAEPKNDGGCDEVNGDACYHVIPASEPVEPFEVPPGHMYVLGDNRPNSRDSRHLGAIPLHAVLGVAEYLFLPGEDMSRMGVLR